MHNDLAEIMSWCMQVGRQLCDYRKLGCFPRISTLWSCCCSKRKQKIGHPLLLPISMVKYRLNINELD